MINEFLDKDYHVHADASGIRVEQDIAPHLEWAKMQREMNRSNRFSRKADTGFKPFCNVPDTVALDIMTKYHINVHDKNIQPEEMRKFKSIMKTKYPHLMYR
jgi:hypothetical protein